MKKDKIAGPTIYTDVYYSDADAETVYEAYLEWTNNIADKQADQYDTFEMTINGLSLTNFLARYNEK